MVRAATLAKADGKTRCPTDRIAPCTDKKPNVATMVSGFGCGWSRLMRK